MSHSVFPFRGVRSSLGRAASQIVPTVLRCPPLRERCSKWYRRKLRTAPPRKTDPRPLIYRASIVQVSLRTREASRAGPSENQVAGASVSRKNATVLQLERTRRVLPLIRTNVTVTRGWHSECSVDWPTGHRYLLIPSDGQCISLLHCGIYYLRALVV